MMERLWLIIACVGSLFVASCGQEPAANSMQERLVLDLNKGWSFQRTEGDDGRTPWHTVQLPHTPRIEPTVVNDQWQGDAWYKRTLVLDPSWRGKRFLIRFAGAMNAAELSVNGSVVARHLGGYLPFVADLTDVLSFDRPNVIEVHLDNRDNPITGPKPLKLLDFNMYGGLYREATLTVLNPVHISDEILANTPAGGGILVSYPHVSDEIARISIQTDVVNAGVADVVLQVRQTLFDGDESVASATGDAQALEAGASSRDVQALEVNQPQLWSTSSPHLYRLVTEVLADGIPVDQRETEIGIRHIKITKEGFWLNGRKMYLRGVNRHQEYPYIGYALPENADWRDAVKIKEAGFDYVRLSHYPHSPAFMRAADHLGLLLVDAILGWQYMGEDPAFRAHALQTCRDMIRRDRNHPSVLAWECSLNETAMPNDLVTEFHQIVHAEMPGDQTYSAGWLNEGYDIYLQARQHRLQHYEEPGRPYIVSEYGDWEYYAQNAGFNQQDWSNLKPSARTSRQLLRDGEVRLLQQATNIQEAHNDNRTTPAFADGYWVMFDYNRGYSDDLEASGIMSIHRLPKYSYEFFRSQRDPAEASVVKGGPMVFIANDWTPSSPLDVRVYSNGDEVELFLNGESLGRQAPDVGRMEDRLPHPPFTFRFGSFAPGKLEAVAYIAGKEAARASVRTPGKPVRIQLSYDTSGVSAEAGVQDAVFVYASVVDENGTVVPVNDIAVTYALEGDGVVLNPGPIVTEKGIASALVRIGDRPGDLKITAEVDGTGITPGEPLVIEVKPAS